MKEIEFWVSSLSYGLSWLHVNTICSTCLGILVPGDYWWQGCHCPQSRTGSKGVHSSYQAQGVSFFFFEVELCTTEERKQTPTLTGLYALPLPIFHSDSAMRWAGTFPSWKLPVQNESVQTLFPSWPRHCSLEGLGSHSEKRTMTPKEAEDFVPRQRKRLGKFQGNTWLKPLHSWSKLSVICTPETCRYTWTKSLTILYMSPTWGTIQIRQRFALEELLLITPGLEEVDGVGEEIHRFRKEVFKTYLQTWLNCSAEKFCGAVQTGKEEPLSWKTPFLRCVSSRNLILALLQKLIF